MSKQNENKRLQVNVELKGDDVERFLRFKEKAFMPTNSSAGFRLMIERLNQIEAQQSEEEPAAAPG